MQITCETSNFLYNKILNFLKEKNLPKQVEGGAKKNQI